VRIPQSLRDGVVAWQEDGADWAASLPALAAHACERWELTLGEPYEGGHTAWVAPAQRADGARCVLKLPYPDDESQHEPDALQLWDGDGAVLLLERDEMTRALLLERIEPGTSLLALDDAEEATAIACALLPRLWHTLGDASGFVTATACASHWASDLERAHREHGALLDVALLRGAIDAFEQLAAYDGPSVSLHQDFHRGNVLRGGREPWLAIDPKPLAGEPAFDARWLLYDLLYSEPRSPHDPLELLDLLARELSLDAERVRLWSFARAVENVVWCHESGEPADQDLALAAALA
jgi:streptomycin 6-kinase